VEQHTQVDLQAVDGMAQITLDGPGMHNALDPFSAAALVAACEEIDSDTSIGVAVITGANHTFCSGAVRNFLLSIGSQSSSVAYEQMGLVYRAFERVGQLKVPTIARMEGAAVGAGLNLALAADIRIATVDARIKSGFARLGVHPGGGHLHLIERTSSRQTAAAMGVFARELSGLEAMQRGIVWDAVPAEELDDAVAQACAPLRADPELSRALKTTFELTTSRPESWGAATEVERARQLWSLGRRETSPPTETSAVS
jgi:enoyl-CoA hydratase